MDGFSDLFERATGSAPYRYQVELADAESLPDVLHVPTGSGKTQALLVSWLHQRMSRRAPRRLVYALPMRTLVEQTAEVARGLRERLGLTPDDLPVHVLMGGVEEQEWREHPERNQILVGTIDMLLSRALNRGYAESRFAWPVSFGLLSNDCRWVFDEVQLMGPARATSAQLDGLRGKLGTLLPCETIWASATVDRRPLETVDRPKLGSGLVLPEEDRRGPLAARLEARKLLERTDVSSEAPAAVPRAIAGATAERHTPGTRTLVVLNTVARAQATAVELRKRVGDAGPSVVLLHSRFRPPDRLVHMRAATGEVDPTGPGTIVVATQVIEAGLDMSSRLLVTETAPFSSIVQRLGRCNRMGEHAEATVLWLDGGPADETARGARAAAPYAPADLNATRDALKDLIGSSLSPADIEDLEVAERVEEPVTLRRRDLTDLFDTTPDLSGLDVDIAPFIRADDDRNVTVFFRELPAPAPPTMPADEQPAPSRDELVAVPLSQLGERDGWLFDHIDGTWARRRGRDIPPGATVLLDASDGRYSADGGWDHTVKSVVPIEQASEEQPPEALDGDPVTFGAEPQELCDHLRAAMRAADALASALEIDGDNREALLAAAALHDVGKAHPIFQETLRAAIGVAGDGGSTLWAKSGRRGGRHRRAHFRHELASALAVRSWDDAPSNIDLIAYLVAAHHGKVRLSIRPAPDEERPEDAPATARFALGIVDGDRLPAIDTPIGHIRETALDLSCMELGADSAWSRATLALRDDPSLGPFRLGYLEAILRVADWRASG